MHMLLTALLLTVAMEANAAASDSLRRVGFSLLASPAWQIAMDQYERKWLKGKRSFSLGAEINYSALPNDSDGFAQDYHYPTLSIGAKLSLNNGVTMRRTPDPAWGKAQMVDYDSHLGDIVSVYGAFERPLFRTTHWQLSYMLRAGVGYGPHKYNLHNNIDNELIGSRFSIYFGGGLTATWQVVDDWALTVGVLYGHHSNGALNRPNKGENHVGPMMGVKYTPYSKQVKKGAPPVSPPFKKYWYADFRIGFGGKTLLEDWQLTQFNTDPDDPDYRTDHFQLYASYSAQAALMYRYARRWASGIGLDVYYGTYYQHVRDLDVAAGNHVSHSPWSVGISLHHEAYYRQLSVDMAIGYYLYRQMGTHAKTVEKPYYERIGVFYTLPKLHHMKVGLSVNAHRTKADLTELIVSIPFRLSH